MGDHYEARPLDETVDLAIIGGGPTGLLSGFLARQLGITVSIIDAKPGPLDLGRADALNARTQQYLQVSGILDELLALGIKCNTSSTFAEGDFKSRQSQWWTSLEYCEHPNFLMIGQPVVEEVLLNRLDTPVHYNECAVAIAEDETGVTLTTDKGRTIRSKYALGADGAKSTIRSLLGIGFTGTKPEMIWAVLDTFIDTDFPVCSEIITFQLNGQSRVSWIPRERGMARFYVLLDGEITQERAEASIREHMAPHRVDFTRTEWFSTFDVKERIASAFVSRSGLGRILLAGDAAHVHSVNGGQGLNTGLADAFALTWRVVAAVKSRELLVDGASEKLIQTYDSERRTVAQGVIDVAAALVRDTVHTAKQYVSTIERNAGYITGMGVSYNGTESVLMRDSQRGIWMAGKRCPDILVSSRGDSTPKRLYSIIPYGKYLILKIGAEQGCRCCFREVATHITLSGQDNVTVAVGSTSVEDKLAASTWSFASTIVGPEDRFVVVVRPDMYIGYVGEGESWKDYMGQIFKH